MTVHVIVQNNEGKEVLRFAGEEHKTFHEMAKSAWVELPISCGMWVCGFCRSKIVSGKEYIDIGKKSMPMIDLAEEDILTCVGGVLSSALTDEEDHEIILQARI